MMKDLVLWPGWSRSGAKSSELAFNAHIGECDKLEEVSIHTDMLSLIPRECLSTQVVVYLADHVSQTERC